MLFSIFFSIIPLFASSTVPIDFEKSIVTCLSTDILWEQLEISMVDSEKSWLWPNNESKSKGEGLGEGNRIYVTYNTPFSDPTYTYELSKISALNTLTYSAVKGLHPFKGGATLTLMTQNDGHSVFLWKGEYLTDPSDRLERSFFKRFSRRFFKNLEKNIIANEHLCSLD